MMVKCNFLKAECLTKSNSERHPGNKWGAAYGKRGFWHGLSLNLVFNNAGQSLAPLRSPATSSSLEVHTRPLSWSKKQWLSLNVFCTLSLFQHLTSSLAITSPISLCNYCKHPLHLCLTRFCQQICLTVQYIVLIPFPAQDRHLARAIWSDCLCWLSDTAVKYSLMIAKASITLIHILLLLQASNFGYHTGRKLLWVKQGIKIHESDVVFGPEHLFSHFSNKYSWFWLRFNSDYFEIFARTAS